MKDVNTEEFQYSVYTFSLYYLCNFSLIALVLAITWQLSGKSSVFLLQHGDVPENLTHVCECVCVFMLLWYSQGQMGGTTEGELELERNIS